MSVVISCGELQLGGGGGGTREQGGEPGSRVGYVGGKTTGGRRGWKAIFHFQGAVNPPKKKEKIRNIT